MITLAASALSPEAMDGARLHGVAPTSLLKEEQPYHRHAAYLLAMGADNREVAEALGVTPHAVRSWMREPWFQERVTALMREHGGRDLTQLFANEAFSSLAVMLELRDSAKTPATVRAGICKDILDRHLGKPTQRIESVGVTTAEDPVAEAAALRQRLSNLQGTDANGTSCSDHPTFP